MRRPGPIGGPRSACTLSNLHLVKHREVWVGQRAGLLFAASVLLALGVTFILRDSRGFQARDVDGRRWDDLAGYVSWARLVTLGGIQDAYHGTPYDTYAVYGPVILYGYQVVGAAYQRFVDPTYDREAAEESVWPVRGIKAVALSWHLFTAGAIYLLVTRAAGAARAGIAAALYAANPVALYDVARWAQPDGAHSLFAVLAVGLLSTSAWVWAWAMLALGMLAKPQGLIIAPLVLASTWRTAGLCGLARGVALAAGVSLLVVLPFVVSGRVADVLALPATIVSVQPSVTANAHNLWWLAISLSGVEDVQSVLDYWPLLGPFSYRAVAGLFVLAEFAFAAWLFWTRRASLPEAAALNVLGWFLLTTQAHENHAFVALPLLALAWPERPRLLVPFAVLSCTMLVNMAAGSTVGQVLATVAHDPDGRILAALRNLNAATNLVLYGVWAIAATRRAPAPSPASARSLTALGDVQTA